MIFTNRNTKTEEILEYEKDPHIKINKANMNLNH